MNPTLPVASLLESADADLALLRLGERLMARARRDHHLRRALLRLGGHLVQSLRHDRVDDFHRLLPPQLLAAGGGGTPPDKRAVAAAAMYLVAAKLVESPIVYAEVLDAASHGRELAAMLERTAEQGTDWIGGFAVDAAILSTRSLSFLERLNRALPAAAVLAQRLAADPNAVKFIFELEKANPDAGDGGGGGDGGDGGGDDGGGDGGDGGGDGGIPPDGGPTQPPQPPPDRGTDWWGIVLQVLELLIVIAAAWYLGRVMSGRAGGLLPPPPGGGA